MDLISVIVPVYKVKKYLSKCVESIICQTYKNIEIILVDDGSPDDCGRICDEYAQSDSRIRVIHKENGGLSDARNCGLDNAKGDYILFVDSDDYISHDMIGKLYDRIRKDNSDIALCSFVYVDENYREIECQNNQCPIKNTVVYGHEAISFLYQNKYWYYIVAWNKLYKKEIFNKLRFPVGKIHEDEFVIHHILHSCNTISCLEEPLYYYLQREGSIMAQKDSKKLLNITEALIDRLDFSVTNSYNMLAYCTLKKLAFLLSNLDANNNMAQYCRLYKLYCKISKKVSVKDLSLKRKLVVWLNKVWPGFILGYYKNHTSRTK